MKKHVTQVAIDAVAERYKAALDAMHQTAWEEEKDREYNLMVGIVETFGILTGQDYDTARMMLRKRAGII